MLWADSVGVADGQACFVDGRARAMPSRQNGPALHDGSVEQVQPLGFVAEQAISRGGYWACKTQRTRRMQGQLGGWCTTGGETESCNGCDVVAVVPECSVACIKVVEQGDAEEDMYVWHVHTPQISEDGAEGFGIRGGFYVCFNVLLIATCAQIEKMGQA